MPKSAPLLCLFLIVNISFSQELIHFAFDGNTGDPSTYDSVGSVPFTLFNKFNNPERTKGVIGNALRLDGYTTHAEGNFNSTGITDQISIEAWYATEAFPHSTDELRQPLKPAAIISQQGQNEGFAIEIGPFGEVRFLFYADGIQYKVSSPYKLLERYSWNHIVGTVDLSKRKAYLIVNGMKWAEILLGTHNKLSLHNGKLFLGKNSLDDFAFNLSATHCNGALDEIKIYNIALAENVVLNKYEAIAGKLTVAPPSIFEDFEGNDYGSWVRTGTAFGTSPADGTLPNQQVVEGYEGKGLVNTFLNGDGPTGTLTSPTFNLSRRFITFLIGGGHHPGQIEIRLWVNGEIVKRATGDNHELLTPKRWDLIKYLGQQATIEIIDQHSGGWGHINIDYIVFEDEQPLLDADLTVDPILRHGTDYLRPRYHPMPATAWANEAYGLTWFNNRYHLFFQKSPSSLYINFMHWGHLSSPDLVDWKEERIALAPEKNPGSDNWGIWSGTSTFDSAGVPILVYTGVSTSKASIGVAFPKDSGLIEWKKYENNPVIFSKPNGFEDFRDPFVWQSGGKYFMIVGSAKPNLLGGTLPLYESLDGTNWTFKGSLYNRDDPTVSGRYWEMPAFVKMNEANEYMLHVNAHIPTGNGFIAAALYWIGKWENEQFIPYHDLPKVFEGTRHDMLSPAIGRDSAGRVTYIGIIPETRSEAPQLEAGWRQTFSIPRVLRLMSDSTLGHFAHPNLCRYRENEVVFFNRSINGSTRGNMSEFRGNQEEIKLKAIASEASIFDLKLLQSSDDQQFIRFEFNLKQNQITVDRSKAADEILWGRFRRFDYPFSSTDTIYIHAFIDRSVVELFVDNTVVFSSRAYPMESSQLMDLVVSEGTVTIVEARKWDRKSFGSQSGSDICTPEFIPDRLGHQVVTNLDFPAIQKDKLNLYPNPAKNKVTVEVGKEDADILVRLLDLSGKQILATKLNNPDTLDLSSYETGSYIIEVRTNEEIFSKKLIIER